MPDHPRRILLCDCAGTFRIDAETIDRTTGLTCSRIHSALCTREAEVAARAIAEGDVVIACGQEAARFADIAAEVGAETDPLCVDIRDRAGWSDEGADAAPKMAALIADALNPAPPVKAMDVQSDGLCLVLGAPEVAYPAAERLSDHLSVTVLVPEGSEAPMSRAFEAVQGRLRSARGALGNFEVVIDRLRQLEPSGRGAFGWGPARDGGRSTCDVIVDLSGGPSLFPAPEKREGYLRADPGSMSAVADALMEASHLSGVFEKPVYARIETHLCAHSRSGQPGCTRCLDVCPTGAITPAGEHVEIDPMICAGCGSCGAVCPSGAAVFEDPPVAHLFGRLARLADTWRKAGGQGAPRLLVHDAGEGAEMIALLARFGDGLPADVIPLGLPRVSGFGHAEIVAARGVGFSEAVILVTPRTERDALERELPLAEALLGPAGGVRLIEPGDPDELGAILRERAAEAHVAEPILPLGSRRQVTRLAVRALNPAAAEAPVPLPDGAPYGAVVVDTEACTLCLSCVSQCPSGALGDNPDRPQLRFQEDSCLQCGICRNTCPENAITLVPRFEGSDAALADRVVKEEEPFECIECGKPFGVRSTVEKIVEKLGGKHAMFAESAAVKLIMMCDDCRVKAQFAAGGNPLAQGERPRPRTTDDYLSKRRDH